MEDLSGILKETPEYFWQQLLTNQNGDAYLMRGSDGYLITIPLEQYLVDSGQMWTLSDTKLAVTQNGFYRVKIVAGTRPVFLEIAYTGELKTRIKTYLNPTSTTGDVVKTPFNRDADVAFPSDAQFRVYEITSFLDGTSRGNDYSGANAATNRAGGSNRGIVTKISPNDTLIIELQNVGGNKSDLNLIINMWERRI